MHYSYHNRIKQRIANDEFSHCYIKEDYPRIGKALVLVFNTEPFFRPIRPHKWPEYSECMKKCLPDVTSI